MGRRQLAAAVATLVGVMAAGCTGNATPSPSPPASTPRASTSAPPRGGEATIGSEHWPECLNPILSCGQPETYQTVLYHVLPRAMQFAPDGSLVASALLAEAPTLDNGGLTQAPFTVRFRISDRAVWDDGSPITSEDFAFTWRAILHTRGSVVVDDYQRILAIDTSDPRTAVLRLDEPWAGWTELFGGSKGFVLKESAFPDVDPEAPALNHEMLSDLPFSGGPFRLTEWIGNQASLSDEHAVLERNERYFGPEAHLDRVTFVPWQDLSLGMQSFLAGEMEAINVGAASLGDSGLFPATIDAPGIEAAGGDSTSFEALWFNATEKPLSVPTVREALMFAIDRQGLLDAGILGNNPDAEVLSCGFLAVPSVGGWCRTQPFAPFSYDPAHALALLEQAGYDCSSLPCSKNGKPLQVRYFGHNISRLRSITQEFLMEHARAAGFEFKAVSYEAGVLFGSACPWPKVAVTECAAQVPPDGSVTPWFACDQIYPGGGAFLGLNRIEWCDPEADRLMKQSDAELDPSRRQGLLDSLYQIEATDMMGLPLYSIPTIVAWRADRLAGPIDAYLSSPYGPFFNLSEWYRAAP